MIIKLSPPDGVPPLMLGMNVDQAVTAMSEWGTPEHVVRRNSTPELRVMDPALSRDIFAFFDDGASLTAVEVWRPYGTDTTVIWDGIDIFRTEADQILAEIAARGFAVDMADPFHPSCPDITFGFTREQMTSHFEAVLVAKPGYYSMNFSRTG